MTTFADFSLAHLPGDPAAIDAASGERLRAALAGAKLRARTAQAAYFEHVAKLLGTAPGEVRAFVREVPRGLARAIGELLEGDPVALAEHDDLLAAMGEAEADARALAAYSRRTRTSPHMGNTVE